MPYAANAPTVPTQRRPFPELVMITSIERFFAELRRLLAKLE